MQCFPPGPPPGSQSCRGARCSQFPLTLAHGSADYKGLNTMSDCGEVPNDNEGMTNLQDGRPG